ncbi:cardiolipin synthase [Candidatus Saccharibacteria bacterium]|nr:cardiolipin synthase [Candidatus Saccharibacteria bacterium]
MDYIGVAAALGYIIFSIGLRLWFLFYIPYKRHSSSAIAWLLVVFLIPEIGIPLFFLLGSPKLSKRRRALQAEIDDVVERATRDTNRLKDLDLAQRDRIDSVVSLGQSLGTLPLSLGNTADILPEYNKAITDIVSEVNNATEFVHLEYFILALDNATEPLFEAMEQAVRRGVKVRVLFDAMGFRAYPNKRQMMKRLTDAGIEWRKMLPIRLGRNYNRPDLRNHRKVVVIDDRVAFLGSQNMIDRTYHRKDDIYYDELVVKLSGPIVRQCNVLFASDWYCETGEKLLALLDPKKRPLPRGTGLVPAQVIPSGPGYEVLGNLQLFGQLLYAAKKRIVITNPYFIPEDSLMVACKSAAQRGVEVIMINSEVMDQKAVGYAQRSYYEDLLEAGVKIYLYKAPILLHSKHLTIDDDIAVIGSSNMDIRSFALDLECVVTLYDQSVVKDLKKVQAANLKRSKQLKLSEWHGRPLHTKFFESIARLTSALQ